MLLETLDIKKDDVVIYSQNLFDLEKNFKIIYKDDPGKQPQKITYNQVCRFINEFTPKNLIIYRLLTNIKDFKINLSKYGYFININGASELIYFDPVFAVKELEDYPDAIDFYGLRFRIQQVGLTTLNRKDDLPNFAEIYSIDLIATEAKFQNDKVFADAIFLFDNDEKQSLPNDKSFKELIEKKPVAVKKIPENTKPKAGVKAKAIEQGNEKEKKEQETGSVRKPDNISQKTHSLKDDFKYEVKPDKEHINGIKIIKHEIDEDTDFDYRQILKVGHRKSKEEPNPKQDSVKQDSSKNSDASAKEVFPKIISNKDETKSAFGKFIQERKSTAAKQSIDVNSSTAERNSPLMDIFKSPSSFDDYIKERENKQIVLKLNKK